MQTEVPSVTSSSPLLNYGFCNVVCFGCGDIPLLFHFCSLIFSVAQGAIHIGYYCANDGNEMTPETGLL